MTIFIQIIRPYECDNIIENATKHKICYNFELEHLSKMYVYYMVLVHVLIVKQKYLKLKKVRQKKN